MKHFKLFSFLWCLFFLTDVVVISTGRTEEMKVRELSNDKKMTRRLRRSVTNDVLKWPKGIIPYIIDPTFKAQEGIEALQIAFEFFANYTCVQWLEKTPELMKIVGHNNYVLIIAEESNLSCWADYGMKEWGEQRLSVGSDCWTGKYIYHEILHTMGMVHEQSRSDRDDYIEVRMENVVEGQEEWLQKEDTTNYVPYDLASVMHYRTTAFGKDGKQVMYTKDPNLETLIASTDEMTFYDVADVLLNYKCSAHCPLNDVGKCGDFGILNQKCECYCMTGFNGEQCENVETSYDCGGFYELGREDEALIITSPNYPDNYPTWKICRWVVEGKNGSLPRVVIEDLEMVTEDNSYVCKDWLEVQYNLPGQSGLVYCGKYQNVTHVSSKDSGGKLILTFLSNSYGNDPTLKGFRAKVDAIGPWSR